MAAEAMGGLPRSRRRRWRGGGARRDVFWSRMCWSSRPSDSRSVIFFDQFFDGEAFGAEARDTFENPFQGLCGAVQNGVGWRNREVLSDYDGNGLGVVG